MFDYNKITRQWPDDPAVAAAAGGGGYSVTRPGLWVPRRSGRGPFNFHIKRDTTASAPRRVNGTASSLIPSEPRRTARREARGMPQRAAQRDFALPFPFTARERRHAPISCTTSLCSSSLI